MVGGYLGTLRQQKNKTKRKTVKSERTGCPNLMMKHPHGTGTARHDNLTTNPFLSLSQLLLLFASPLVVEDRLVHSATTESEIDLPRCP